MNSRIWKGWDGSPPRIYVITQEMPGTPTLPLSGFGCADMSIDDYLKNLQRDIEQHKGKYWAYVMGSSGDEADTYFLETWQVLRPDDGTYEAIVILYYSAINPYLTIKKHFGEEAAAEYLAENAVSEVLASAYENI